MSDHDDRILVPVNGHRPRKEATPDALKGDGSPAGPSTTSSAPSTVSAHPPATVSAADDDDLRDPPRIIVTPGQATIVGFGIIASLILVLLGRRRGRKG